MLTGNDPAMIKPMEAEENHTTEAFDKPNQYDPHTNIPPKKMAHMMKKKKRLSPRRCSTGGPTI